MKLRLTQPASRAGAGAWLSLAKMIYGHERIFHDMGPLTLVRMLFQRAFKFEPPLGPVSELKRVPHPKIEKKN